MVVVVMDVVVMVVRMMPEGRVNSVKKDSSVVALSGKRKAELCEF